MNHVVLMNITVLYVGIILNIASICKIYCKISRLICMITPQEIKTSKTLYFDENKGLQVIRNYMSIYTQMDIIIFKKFRSKPGIIKKKR